MIAYHFPLCNTPSAFGTPSGTGTKRYGRLDDPRRPPSAPHDLTGAACVLAAGVGGSLRPGRTRPPAESRTLPGAAAFIRGAMAFFTSKRISEAARCLTKMIAELKSI